MKKRVLSSLIVLCMTLLLCGAAGCNKKEEEAEVCKVSSCDEEVYKKGYCKDHYQDYKDGKLDSNSDSKDDSKDDLNDDSNAKIPEKAEAQGTYLSSTLAELPEKFGEVKTTVDEGSGMTVTADVKIGGSLLDLVKMYYLSGITDKELDRLSVGVSMDVDAKGDESGLTAKLTLNGESLDAKAFLKDGSIYVGIPALSNKYLQLDLKDLIGDQLLEMQNTNNVDTDAVQKSVESLIADITAAVTPSREEADAVISVKNTSLGIDTSVSGTMFVDTVESKKFMEAVKKCMVDVMRASGVPEDQIREIEAEMAEDMDDNGNFILSLIRGEDGSFALKIEMENEDGAIKIVNNAKYALFSIQERAEAQDQLFVYVEKTGKKTGNVFFVEDNKVIDTVKLSYEILKDGIKLAVTADVEGMGVIQSDITITKKNVEIAAKFVSDGQEWINLKFSMKQRDYKNPMNGALDAISDPEEWAETLSIDKLEEFFHKALGISILDLMNGYDESWDDDDWDDYDWDDYDWDDDWGYNGNNNLSA